MSANQPFNEFSSVSGGGGFVNSDSRPNSGESGGPNYRTNTLTPVTIKQILEAKQQVQDGPFVIHNQELHHVSFVGVVRNITDKTSNVELTIEDGTAQIDVRKWSDDTSDMKMSQEGSGEKDSSQVAQQYHIGEYVKVYGALKEFGGKSNVQYAVIKIVDSFNDVIMHHLEVIKCFAIANGKLKQPAMEEGAQQQDGKSLFVQEDERAANSENPKERVLAYCRARCQGQDPNDFGVPIPQFVQALDLDEDTVKQCCDTLTEQGFIYPTITDTTYFPLNGF
ncbi:hypothetical protein ZYGR_0AI01220 [Zygosaccharomyces rouxii]|uniref:Replication protein A C-terminal domain-containing protein n=1 Tax=Zygosaccharomyces rouxii TaxID=4956 RepID=A0A1Q3AB56_ZYGRO|nr:hypothetical protein ZYGR_0AI01220 [Zygosaccharomyces rouxii]